MNYLNQDDKLIKQIIFDTGGANNTFIHNLNILNYPLYALDYIVLSHWHYDHFGSLFQILERINKPIPIITHENALFERLFKRARGIKNEEIIGKSKTELLPLIFSSKIIIQEALNVEKLKSLNGNILFRKEDTEIFNEEGLKIIVSGEIPRKNKEEEFDGFFSIQNNVGNIDKIYDDKCLIFEFEENNIILNGCCHSGLINTLNYVRRVSSKPISHVIGGFHMANATQNRIDFTLDYLKKLKSFNNFLYLFPIHCSGEQIINNINRIQGEQLKAFNSSVGTIFTFFTN